MPYQHPKRFLQIGPHHLQSAPLLRSHRVDFTKGRPTRNDKRTGALRVKECIGPHFAQKYLETILLSWTAGVQSCLSLPQTLRQRLARSPSERGWWRRRSARRAPPAPTTARDDRDLEVSSWALCTIVMVESWSTSHCDHSRRAEYYDVHMYGTHQQQQQPGGVGSVWGERDRSMDRLVQPRQN